MRTRERSGRPRRHIAHMVPTSLLPLLRDRALAGLTLCAELTLGDLVESGVGGWVATLAWSQPGRLWPAPERGRLLPSAQSGPGPSACVRGRARATRELWHELAAALSGQDSRQAAATAFFSEALTVTGPKKLSSRFCEFLPLHFCSRSMAFLTRASSNCFSWTRYWSSPAASGSVHLRSTVLQSTTSGVTKRARACS